MSSYAFRQEFMASFEALGSEIFKEDWIQFSNTEPDDGDYYIAVDLAGFADVASNATGKGKRLDKTAIAIVKAGMNGWWVADIISGRWDIKKTARKIFEAVDHYQPVAVGIEKGALRNAVIPYLTDLMKSGNRYFRVEELTHGNKKKIDRIVWALQGRFEHSQITLSEGEWNTQFLDELFQFPNPLVHDDLVDALAYVDQLAKVSYYVDFEEEEFEIIDPIAGY